MGQRADSIPFEFEMAFLLGQDDNLLPLAIEGMTRTGYHRRVVQTAFHSRLVEKRKSRVGLADDFGSYFDSPRHNQIGKRTDPERELKGKRNPMRQRQ